MHCLSRSSRSHHHHLRHVSPSVVFSAPTAAVRSAAPTFQTLRLSRTQSFLSSTHSRPNSHSYGVSFMDSQADFSTNSLSATNAAASVDADVINCEEPDSSRNSYSSASAGGREVAAGGGECGKEKEEEEEESVIAPEDGEERGERGEEAALPEELLRSVVKLTCESTAGEGGGVCDVYLVGTAHVSSESCQKVEAVISALKPQVVFLELCSSRVAVLQPQNLKIPTMGEMVEMWKKNHNLFGILYGWFLAKVASKLEVLPGAEFRVAYEEAMKYGGKVILGDRPVQITLRRTWAKMPLWHKIKLLSSLLFQAFSLPNPDDLSKMLKEMDDVDMLTLVIQEMSKQFPTLMETLVHERDRFMSSTLLRVAHEHTSVVAVVGKGHLPGIQKHWNQPIEVKELLIIPTQTPIFSTRRILTSIGVAVAGAAIVSGIYVSSKK